MRRLQGILLAACLGVVPCAMAGVAVPSIDVTVTGTATLITASNGARAALSCTNNSASVHVRWGDSSVTATTGQRFPFGSSIQIISTGPIYMISEGANVTVSCTEELK